MINADLYDLTKLLADMHRTKFSARVAHAITVNHKRLLPLAVQYEQDRVAIVVEHAAKDDAGAPIIIDGSYQIVSPDDFNTAIADLGAREVDVSLSRINLDDLTGEFSPNDLNVMAPMLAGGSF